MVMMALWQHCLGYASTVLFLYCLIFKKVNKFILRMDNFKLVKTHMCAGILAVILSIIHSYDKILITGLSFGIVALIIMILIALTGFAVKNMKGEKRRRVLEVHKGLCVFGIILIIIHIAEYYIMEI